MHRFMLISVPFLVICSLVLAVPAAVDEGPASIKIDINGKDKKVSVFSHKKHLDMPDLKDKCNQCHHTAKPGEKIKKCGECHTQVKEKDPKTGAPGFKASFHKQCALCHKKKLDKPELKKCKTCHGE